MTEIMALILLLFRLIATRFLVKVLKAQWVLMKRPLDQRAQALVDEEDILGYRKQLFYLTLALAGSNLLPIVVDLHMFASGMGFVLLTGWTDEFLIAYTISNACAAVLASYLIYRIYRNALEVDKTHVESDHILMNNE